MSTTDDNNFVAFSHHGGDWPSGAVFWAFPGEPTYAPDQGFLASGIGNNPHFKIGGQFGGWFYGVQGTGGFSVDADAQHKVLPPVIGNPFFKFGPEVNDYSNFAGVFGTGVFVTGVAGTSVNNVGVYGQTEEDPDSSIPQTFSAGVVGAATTGSGVVGWSTTWNGVEGWAYQGTAVLGVSDIGYGVQGASTLQPGVLGWSENDTGVIGGSGPEGTQGPTVPNTSNTAGVVGTSDAQHGVIGTTNANVGVIGFSTNNIGVLGYTTAGSYAGFFLGDLGVTGTKAAVVPFPDGTHRALYCMESPELWFEDFGTAKLKRGRAVVKLDANFAKVIKTGSYHVFVTPEGDCGGVYVHRKNAGSFEVRELGGGKASIAFSYRIVGRRKDIKGHRRFAKIDTRLPLPAAAARAPRKAAPTRAGLRAFAARADKKARARRPKRAEAMRRAFVARAEKAARARPPIQPQLQLPRAKKK
jgi:hypothetical protein